MRHHWDRFSPAGALKMGVKQAAEGPTISRHDPGQANHAREGHLQNRKPHCNAAHPADTCRLGSPARVTLRYPTSAAGARECGPALTALQAVLWSMDTNPICPLSTFLPRFLDGGHAPQAPEIHHRQRTGRGPRHRPIFVPDVPFSQARHEVEQGVQLNTRDPRARRLPPANMGILGQAQPAAPCGIPRRQST